MRLNLEESKKRAKQYGWGLHEKGNVVEISYNKSHPIICDLLGNLLALLQEENPEMDMILGFTAVDKSDNTSTFVTFVKCGKRKTTKLNLEESKKFAEYSGWSIVEKGTIVVINYDSGNLNNNSLLNFIALLQEENPETDMILGFTVVDESGNMSTFVYYRCIDVE